MAFIRNTEYRELPNRADLVELECLSDYDFALRYQTDSHDIHSLNEDLEVNIKEKNTLDVVEVLFREEQYDEVIDTVNAQLEADRKAREHRYT